MLMVIPKFLRRNSSNRQRTYFCAFGDEQQSKDPLKLSQRPQIFSDGFGEFSHVSSFVAWIFEPLLLELESADR
jgi:hypothetical protein